MRGNRAFLATKPRSGTATVHFCSKSMFCRGESPGRRSRKSRCVVGVGPICARTRFRGQKWRICVHGRARAGVDGGMARGATGRRAVRDRSESPASPHVSQLCSIARSAYLSACSLRNACDLLPPPPPRCARVTLRLRAFGPSCALIPRAWRGRVRGPQLRLAYESPPRVVRGGLGRWGAERGRGGSAARRRGGVL